MPKMVDFGEFFFQKWEYLCDFQTLCLAAKLTEKD